MINATFWLGIFAAGLVTAANVPQAWKIFRTRDTSAISTWTYSLLIGGNACWIFYGFLQDDVSIILSNAIAVLLCTAILLMKIFPGLIPKK